MSTICGCELGKTSEQLKNNNWQQSDLKFEELKISVRKTGSRYRNDTIDTIPLFLGILLFLESGKVRRME